MSSPSADAASTLAAPVSRRKSAARSVLERSLLGIVLLFVMVAGGVWLMHASIEAEADALRNAELSLKR
jgi:hypothetical protein